MSWSALGRFTYPGTPQTCRLISFSNASLCFVICVMRRLCKTGCLSGITTLAMNVSHVGTRTRHAIDSTLPTCGRLLALLLEYSYYTFCCRSPNKHFYGFDVQVKNYSTLCMYIARKQSIRKAGERVLLFHCIRQAPSHPRSLLRHFRNPCKA
jgi:hypothetical protein